MDLIQAGDSQTTIYKNSVFYDYFISSYQSQFRSCEDEKNEVGFEKYYRVSDYANFLKILCDKTDKIVWKFRNQ